MKKNKMFQTTNQNIFTLLGHGWWLAKEVELMLTIPPSKDYQLFSLNNYVFIKLLCLIAKAQSRTMGQNNKTDLGFFLET